MIQYIIAAGIGAFLGSQSKKSKKSYAEGGEIYNAHILTNDNKLIHRRYPKKITQKEIYKEYKDKGVEIKDSQIHFAKPIDFFDILREETKKYVRENMNDDVESKSIFISSMQKGNEYIATEIKGDTISGKSFTITPKDLFEVGFKGNSYAEGGSTSKSQKLIDKIAQKEFGKKYSDLNDSDKYFVDDAYASIQSEKYGFAKGGKVKMDSIKAAQEHFGYDNSEWNELRKSKQKELREVSYKRHQGGSSYAEGGGVDEVYINYLNKDKDFFEERKSFKTYEDAKQWGRKEFENFNPDMISYYAKGGKTRKKRKK
jgi:hypothetical protein